MFLLRELHPSKRAGTWSGESDAERRVQTAERMATRTRETADAGRQGHRQAPPPRVGDTGAPAGAHIDFMLKNQNQMLLCVESGQRPWSWLYFSQYPSVRLKYVIIKHEKQSPLALSYPTAPPKAGEKTSPPGSGADTPLTCGPSPRGFPRGTFAARSEDLILVPIVQTGRLRPDPAARGGLPKPGCTARTPRPKLMSGTTSRSRPGDPVLRAPEPRGPHCLPERAPPPTSSPLGLVPTDFQHRRPGPEEATGRGDSPQRPTGAPGGVLRLAPQATSCALGPGRPRLADVTHRKAQGRGRVQTASPNPRGEGPRAPGCAASFRGFRLCRGRRSCPDPARGKGSGARDAQWVGNYVERGLPLWEAPQSLSRSSRGFLLCEMGVCPPRGVRPN